MVVVRLSSAADRKKVMNPMIMMTNHKTRIMNRMRTTKKMMMTKKSRKNMKTLLTTERISDVDMTTIATMKMKLPRIKTPSQQIGRIQIQTLQQKSKMIRQVFDDQREKAVHQID